jgi:hypothetical protein
MDRPSAQSMLRLGTADGSSAVEGLPVRDKSLKEGIMLYRVASLCLMALALFLFLGAQVPAAQDKEANTHEGTVVNVTATKLVMKGKDDNKEHTHTLAADAKVTCDGKACKLDELRAGQRIRVTTKAGDQSIAVRIEALDKERTFSKGAGG